MDKNKIVAVINDLHINSVAGLSHPRFMLDDGGEHVAGKVQRWIWHNYLQYVDEVAAAKDRYNAEVYLLINGETADNNKHSTTTLVTRNPADQIKHAILALTPMLDIAEHILITRGTEAHSGAASHMDEIVGRDVGAIQDPETDNYSWPHFYGNIGGVLFDAQHHAESSYSRPSTKGGASNRIASDLVYTYADLKAPLPDLALRAHTHRVDDSADNHPVRVIVNASFAVADAFVHRIGGGGSRTQPIGGMYIVCNGGNYEVFKRWIKWPMKRKMWTESNLQKTN